MQMHTARSLDGVHPIPALEPRAFRFAPMAHLAAALAALKDAIAREARLRRDYRELMAMDDHQLSDIGLTRTEVYRAVRFGEDPRRFDHPPRR